MGVKSKGFSASERQKLIRGTAGELYKAEEKEIKAAAKAELERLYNLTLAGADFTTAYVTSTPNGISVQYHNEWEPPEVKLVFVESRQVRAGFQIKIRISVVQSGSSSPHDGWYYLSRGTDDFTQRRTSPAFLQREYPLRTYTLTGEGGLSLGAGEFSDRIYSVQAGDVRPGQRETKFEEKIFDIFRGFVVAGGLVSREGSYTLTQNKED